MNININLTIHNDSEDSDFDIFDDCAESCARSDQSMLPSAYDYCAFSHNHRCIQWVDYEITRNELAEANELCHGNWIEIQTLQDRVDQLAQLLRDLGIELPPEC